MLRAGGLVAAAGLAGCLSTPDEAPSDAADHDAAWVCADGDGDHWPAGRGGACETAEHLDCDDDDPAEHPGAYESASPIADVDCDGVAWDGSGRMSAVVAAGVADDLMVTIGSLELRIDDDAGHSIADLRVTPSDNLLFTGPMNERLIAVEAWQSFFSWEDGGDEDTLDVQVDSRALLRFQVGWADGTDMTGTTTWTMHAGGRLYRRDEIDLATPPSESNVTAYVALDDSAITHVDFANNPGAPIEVPPFAPSVFDTWANTTPSEQWLCAFHDSAMHEIGFLADATASVTTESVRITRSQGASSDTAQLALQYDWNIGGPPAAVGAYSGSFQIVAGPSAGGACATTAQADQAWREPPRLILRDGTPGTAPPGEDANDDDFAEGGGYWPVVATSSPFEIELMSGGSVPATITFRIEGLPDGDPVITVEHDLTVTRYVHGRDYLLHQGGGFTWLVIRAIPGNVIRIVPPPVPPF